MAIDNLNYYSAWLPAGQQTDRYSSQPWCLRSKNLDIFSSSKSVKATAWSVPSTWDSDIIKQDGKLILKTDWKVYERQNWTDTLFIDPSTNFPSYDVCYTWPNWTFAPAAWGTAQDMIVKYEWDERKSFVVFTDRASFVYSKTKFVFDKSFESASSCFSYEGNFTDWYQYRKVEDNTAISGSIDIKIDKVPLANVPIRVYAKEYNGDESNISLTQVGLFRCKEFYYNAKVDWVVASSQTQIDDISFSWSITQDRGILLDIPMIAMDDGSVTVRLTFTWTPKEWWSRKWNYGQLYIDINWWPTDRKLMTKLDGTKSDWDSNYYYTYLPLRERKLVDIGSYAYSSSYWLKGVSFQTLYKWTSYWQEMGVDNFKLIYDFVQDMGWESDSAMDVIWMTVWNEQVYMIWNLDWNWYIIPCDLSWGRWTPFIAYWCTFKGVTNIDYLMYLVWEDRWISTLWVFNNQELVPILWWKLGVSEWDLIWVDEQYKFDWKITNWRKNLILTTSDNRIFQYGQTYGGKWWSFIHELPSNATITDLKANWNDLEVHYSVTVNDVTTKYSISYQDDVAIKNYNELWEAVYPIVLWNHLLEKEESDLFASYILPNKDCSIEFWGMANHYHFWTFTSYDNQTLSTSTNYKLKWATGNYKLKFIERNGTQYTFRLEWDLPIQNGGWQTITTSEWSEVLNYTEFNHFRKIWEITTNGYIEWEFRFHNLNNKLELPKSHSLQIMAKGWGTSTATPELFALDLVANQRDRW